MASSNRQVNEMFTGVQKNRMASRFAVGPVSLQFVTIILLALFSLMYLLQNNQMTTQGYKLAQLKSEQVEILQQNEKYQVEAARLKALGEVKKKVENLEMETVESVRYLAVE
ncbi:hypothetical protein KJ855_04285 [Patescibacteria group bacterium]|nr:hypothetical protein [Patescibacteria group bacterium]